MNDLIGVGKATEAVERTTREFREILRDVVGPPAKALGDYLARRFQFYGAERIAKAFEKAREQIRASGLELRPIDLKIVFPILDGAALEEDDGLTLAWFGTVFVNPPYGRDIHHWTTKARLEVEQGNAQTVVSILPARTDTRWWHTDVARIAHVLFLRGRLAFGDVGQVAPFPSALVVWGGKDDQLINLQKTFPDAWFIPSLAVQTALTSD